MPCRAAGGGGNGDRLPGAEPAAFALEWIRGQIHDAVFAIGMNGAPVDIRSREEQRSEGAEDLRPVALVLVQRANHLRRTVSERGARKRQQRRMRTNLDDA